MKPGDTFGNGKYTLLRKLKTSGMAEVWLARQHGTGGFVKDIVIKRILPHLAEDEKLVTMFLDEARIAANLNHPNVVQIFDLGQDGKDYFIAMEYIRGYDLEQIEEQIKKRQIPFPIEIGVQIISDTCLGLAYAHDFKLPDGTPLNVVHRDVSPQNILLSETGVVKLIDFGIAKARTSSTKTQVGHTKGKICYMSPEQMMAKPLDRRSDIFSLGVVMYEMLCGVKPFDGENLLACYQCLKEGIVPPRQIRGDIPPELERIIMKALAYNRDERYPTATAMRFDLQNFLTEQGVSLGPEHLSDFLKWLFAPPDGTQFIFDYPKKGAHSSPKLASQNNGNLLPVGTSPPYSDGNIQTPEFNSAPRVRSEHQVGSPEYDYNYSQGNVTPAGPVQTGDYYPYGEGGSYNYSAGNQYSYNYSSPREGAIPPDRAGISPPGAPPNSAPQIPVNRVSQPQLAPINISSPDLYSPEPELGVAPMMDPEEPPDYVHRRRKKRGSGKKVPMVLIPLLLLILGGVGAYSLGLFSTRQSPPPPPELAQSQSDLKQTKGPVYGDDIPPVKEDKDKGKAKGGTDSGEPAKGDKGKGSEENSGAQKSASTPEKQKPSKEEKVAAVSAKKEREKKESLSKVKKSEKKVKKKRNFPPRTVFISFEDKDRVSVKIDRALSYDPLPRSFKLKGGRRYRFSFLSQKGLFRTSIYIPPGRGELYISCRYISNDRVKCGIQK